MATRLVFKPKLTRPYFEEHEIEFKYFTGFAKQQKNKSIESLHNAIYERNLCNNILEVSTSSSSSLGHSLSAFKLKSWSNAANSDVPIENIFQSSKKFIVGGPYLDLLLLEPWNSKKDNRLFTSGDLISFELDSENYELTPKSAFYDWIYINALKRKLEVRQDLISFDGFTDIEFNHTKSFNCQARSVAIFVGLLLSDNLDSSLKSFDLFCGNYLPILEEKEVEQLSLFNLL